MFNKIHFPQEPSLIYVTCFCSLARCVVILCGPVPRKMVKFNPGLSQISSTVFSSKNMQVAVSKYC